MGWNFSALLRYSGPTAACLSAISILEETEEYLPLQPVLDCGLAKGFGPGTKKGTWLPFPEIDSSELPRPKLPTLQTWLELPCGFHLVFGADAIWVYHTARWSIFLHDPDWQTAVLQGIQHLVGLFQASDCIVTRDEHPAILAFHDDTRFSEALSACEPSEGAVERLSDLAIDLGISDELIYEGADRQHLAVPIWDSKGYWHLLKPFPTER